MIMFPTSFFTYVLFLLVLIKSDIHMMVSKAKYVHTSNV